MIADGATRFYEFGHGDVLKGLIRKINAEVEIGKSLAIEAYNAQTLGADPNFTNMP